EELVGKAALLEQGVPGGHVDLVRPPRDLLAVLAGQVAEQRERFQALRVHRFLLSWRASCHGRPSAATRGRSPTGQLLDSATEACRSGRTGPPRKRLGV